MKHKPIEVLRKTVSFLYREIGVLKYRNHPNIYSKRKESYGFFDQHSRKKMAKEIYFRTINITDPEIIIGLYKDKTGLSLEDIHIAFRDGDWEAPTGGIYYGGPKWAKIAQKTIDLRDSIIEEKSALSEEISSKLVKLPHNTGYLIDKFGIL